MELKKEKYVIDSLKEDKMKNQVKWSIKPEKVEKVAGLGVGGQGGWGSKWKKEPGQQTETVEGVVDINPTVLISTSIINCLKTNERQTQ